MLWHENTYRTPATVTALMPNRLFSFRLDPAGHRREDPQGRAVSIPSRLNVSEETEAVARRMFSSQSR